MLRDVGVNFRISRFCAGNQSLLRIGLGQQPGLLEHDLQLDLSLFVNALLYPAAFTHQHLAQLVADFLQLIFGNLLASHRRIARLCIFNELLESLFLSWLLKKSLRVSVGHGRCGLRLSVTLRDDKRFYQFELPLYLRTIGDSPGTRFFRNCKQFAYVLREIFSRFVIGCQTRASLRRLIAGELRHVVGTQIYRGGMTRLHLPND